MGEYSAARLEALVGNFDSLAPELRGKVTTLLDGPKASHDARLRDLRHQLEQRGVLTGPGPVPAVLIDGGRAGGVHRAAPVFRGVVDDAQLQTVSDAVGRVLGADGSVRTVRADLDDADGAYHAHSDLVAIASGMFTRRNGRPAWPAIVGVLAHEHVHRQVAEAGGKANHKKGFREATLVAARKMGWPRPPLGHEKVWPVDIYEADIPETVRRALPVDWRAR